MPFGRTINLSCPGDATIKGKGSKAPGKPVSPADEHPAPNIFLHELTGSNGTKVSSKCKVCFRLLPRPNTTHRIKIISLTVSFPYFILFRSKRNFLSFEHEIGCNVRVPRFARRSLTVEYQDGNLIKIHLSRVKYED